MMPFISPDRQVSLWPVSMLGSSSLSSGGYIFINAEAAALVARFTTPPTNVRKALIDAWWTTVKAAGVSSADLDVFTMLAAADTQAATRNWMADLYNSTVVGAPAFVADRGYTGAVGGYLDTGFNPTTAVAPKYTLNDASMGVFVRTNVSEGARDLGNTLATIGSRTVTDTILGRANDGAAANVALAVVTSIGQSSWSRTNSANYQIRKNGADLGVAQAVVSTSLSNESMRILSGVTTGSTKEACAAWFGRGLTQAKDAAIYAATLTYLQAVGAM